MSLKIKQRLRLFFAAVLLSVLFIIGCKFSPSAGNGSGVGNPGPETFATWDELETYVKTEFSESVVPSTLYYSDSLAEGASFSNFANNTTRSDYSQTNVQEAGVDESDKIKTDGQYLYISAENSVHIVSAVPADSMSTLGTINVNGSVDSVYLYNDYLVILYNPVGDIIPLGWAGPDIDIFWGMGLPYWIPVHGKTGILIMDISNPLSPERVKELTFDGWMISSRLADGRLHMVQQFLPELPPLQYTYDGTDEGRDEVIAANEQVMETVSLEDLVPYYEVIDEQGTPGAGAPVVTPNNFYHPEDSEGGSIVYIATFDLDNIYEEFRSTGLIADASTVYASTEALYIAASKWNYGIYDSSSDEYYMTSLYKFAFDSTGVTLEGSGETRGRILNQFSLGEYSDVLRIATSTGGWGASLRSNIYCLEAIDNHLKIIGRLEGLAPGEDIYAARFIGPRGFLVTFVKVDPLFTIDLSDPSNPVVAGELKVPGYSDYIHPIGNDHLVTIGKNTILEGSTVWYQGLQLSIFDISDFSNPQLLHTELIGDRGTNSEALDNHKAFTFWAENGLLAIPVDLYEHQTEPAYPYTYGEHTFTGLYVYRVTIEGGFEYLGRISTLEINDQFYYYSNWLRGLFIDEDVYAVNAEAVRSASIENIEGTLNTLVLPDGN